MPRDFFPTQELNILNWSKVFYDRIQAEHVELGLTEQQVQAYGEAHLSFAEMMALANAPSTRTRPVLAGKNAARKALEDQARMVARILRANPAVTPQQRVNLGLSVPRPAVESISAPKTAPFLLVDSVIQRRVKVKLRDGDSVRCRKPSDVSSAAVYYFVGEQPDADMGRWTYLGNFSTARITLQIPNSVPPGSPVWLVAQWVNAKSQCGPWGTPQCMGLAGASMMNVPRSMIAA